MSRRIVFVSTLVLLLVGLPALAFELPRTRPATTSVNTDPVWYVGQLGNFTTIQGAINSDNVTDGDTIEVVPQSPIYYENVTVNKSLTIRRWTGAPPGAYPTVDSGNKTGTVFYVNASGVEIDGFVIQNGACGVYVGASNCALRNNTVTSNTYGIFLGSGNNTLTNNTMSGNLWNFGVSEDGVLDDFVQDVNDSNTVDGKKIYYWVNKHDDTIPTDAGYVAVVNSTGITAENLSSLQNNLQDVLVAYSSQVRVRDFKHQSPLAGNTEGVVFVNVNNSAIQNVTLSHVYCGVLLQNSTNNSIQDVTLSYASNGVLLNNSTDNSIQHVTLTATGNGIQLTDSENNSLQDNVLTSDICISLRRSVNSSIVANTIHCFYAGLSVDDSSGSIIFHNNFVHMHSTHGYNEAVCESLGNGFDNGFEGNYWDDYSKKCPNATETDNTGIWNTSYPIDRFAGGETLGYDNHPLVEPWSANRVFNRTMLCGSSGQSLCTFSNSTIGTSSFSFNRTKLEISLKVTSGNSGFMNITIPRNWIDGPFNVSIDGNQVGYVFSVNGTHSSLCIMLNNGTQTVRVTGAELGGITGDINADGTVDIFDAIALAGNYGAQEKTP